MSVRSVAVRQAAKLRSERAAAFAVREAAIEELTVGFLEASGRAEDVVQAALRRCEQIMTAARTAAERCRAQAATSVAGLHGMGVPRAEIAQLTGLSAREVRDLLASRPSPAPLVEADHAIADDDGHAAVQEPGPDAAGDAQEDGDTDSPVTGEGGGQDVAWPDAAGGPAVMPPREAQGPYTSP